MRALLLPFFIARLGLAHTGFASVVLKDHLQKYKSLLLIIILSLFLVGIGVLNNSLAELISLQSHSATVGFAQQVYPLTIINRTETNHLSLATQNAVSLAELAAANQKQLLLHPTHRDLLINQLLLSSYLGKTTETQQLLDQLKTIDPNHPVVKSFPHQ